MMDFHKFHTSTPGRSNYGAQQLAAKAHAASTRAALSAVSERIQRILNVYGSTNLQPIRNLCYEHARFAHPLRQALSSDTV